MAILRKVKAGLKKVVKKKQITGALKKSLPLRTVKSQKPKDVDKEILGAQETVVGKTKFSTPPATKAAPRILEELPTGYGQDKIVLQVRDSRWLHAYWEVTMSTWDNLRQQLGESFNRAKKLLRVYDVTNIIFNGKNAHHSFDQDVTLEATNWYIDTNGPGKSWCVDLGLLLPDGRFITIVRSNTVQTPLEGPSWITDEEWMIPDDMFARLYGMGFGFGRSSPVGRAWQERMRRVLFSGAFASGMSSMGSPVKKARGRKFWLVVNTELIVYGATEPDAKVTIQGRPLDLKADGTFSVRFALPDGKQVIPVEATSSDGVETRTITPSVARETKSSAINREHSKI